MDLTEPAWFRVVVRDGDALLVTATEERWLGIDFSGNHEMWKPRRKSNIFVADVRAGNGRYRLHSLLTVQELDGPSLLASDMPFQRLGRVLGRRDFIAAGIDAPFCVPYEFMPDGGHPALLELVAEIEHPNRPFPEAKEFVSRILNGRTPATKKPLRPTEMGWRKRNINVRSSLWSGARGGAAMTAACLSLLHRSGCPIWPWCEPDEPGLLAEAFPAAQLCHWGLGYTGYNGNDPAAKSKRIVMTGEIGKVIDIPEHDRGKMEECADALDAVLCAFGAIALSTGRWIRPAEMPRDGMIAVHGKI